MLHDRADRFRCAGGRSRPTEDAAQIEKLRIETYHHLSPWDRVSVYLSLCAVSNRIRRFKRPGYIAHRDFTPIECLPDDCLLRHYDVPLPWKDGTPAEELQGALQMA